MKHVMLIATGLVCAAAASFAATGGLSGAEPGVIEIEVSAAELAECRATLAQVAGMPAVADNGSPLLFGASQDLPDVRCVVSDA